MKILVTGGAGFIGSAVCRYFVSTLGHDVVNVDKLTYAANLHSLDSIVASPNYTFVEADICDRAAMDAVIGGHQPDAVLHLAAESHVDRSISGSADFVRTNLFGTYTMLEAALAYWNGFAGARRDRFKFLHISTDEVFGSLGSEGAFDEATAYDPSSPYSATKAGSDHLAKAWHRTYGLPVVISNCSNNYGPFQFPEKLIPLMVLNAMEGKALPVYGDGKNVRDWLYVDDHVRALACILERGRPGETYAVGGRSERSNLDIVHAICGLLDAERPGKAPHAQLISFVADRPGHDRRYAIDPQKIETELGWRAEETLVSGLAKTVAWYLSSEDWWRPLRERVYAGQRLGLI